MSTPLSALAPRAAYRLWAAGYEVENAVTTLEDAAVARVTPPLAGRALLDAGCGTGRRLRHTNARCAVGIDLAPEMLMAGDVPAARAMPIPREVPAATPVRIAADVRALPLTDSLFDVVWCRLVLGHLAQVDRAYAELARVAAPGATLIVSDFHPDAVAAGHTRSFRDSAGTLHTVEHHVHTLEAHTASAAAAGWKLLGRHDALIGPAVRSFYARADALDRYEAQRGLALVLVLVFRR